MTRAVDSRHDRIVGTWVAEQSRSRIEFRIGRRLVGRFERYAAIAKTGADPSDTSIRIVVHAASFRTEEGHDRGDRLRSIVVLRSNEFPSITYRAADFERTEDGIVAHGELTVNGIARPFDAVADVSRPVTDEDGRTRLALGLRGTVRRADYRLGAGLERRVRDVDVTVRLVFVLQGSAGRVAPGTSRAPDESVSGTAGATVTGAATPTGARVTDTGAVTVAGASDSETAPSAFVAKLPTRADRRERGTEVPASDASATDAKAPEASPPEAPAPEAPAPDAPTVGDDPAQLEVVATMRWRTATDDDRGEAHAAAAGPETAPDDAASDRADEPVTAGSPRGAAEAAPAAAVAETDADASRATTTAEAPARTEPARAAPRSHGRPFWQRLLARLRR